MVGVASSSRKGLSNCGVRSYSPPVLWTMSALFRRWVDVTAEARAGTRCLGQARSKLLARVARGAIATVIRGGRRVTLEAFDVFDVRRGSSAIQTELVVLFVINLTLGSILEDIPVRVINWSGIQSTPCHPNDPSLMRDA